MPYPDHTQRTIVKAWTFRSNSDPDKTYETLLYDDQTTSCSCPGWTRRVYQNGARMCRHTRSVDMNMADREAVAFVDYDLPSSQQQPNQKDTNAKERKNGSREVGQLGKRKLL